MAGMKSEMAPRTPEEKTMKTRLADQIEAILKQRAAAEASDRALRVGDSVKMKACETMPEVVGDTAEVVDMQIPDSDRCATYPVWVRMTSGTRKGKIYGFNYGEMEVMPKKGPREVSKTELVEQLDRILEALKVGGKVKIKKCETMPEVVGDTAEVVDMQIQDSDKYAAFPVWVRMTSGKRNGKIYGFTSEELEIMPRVQTVKRTQMDEQLEQISRSVTTIEDIAEIERAIGEVKGKILTAPATGFWTGKTACWEMFRCPDSIRNECPAYKHQELPCWQIAGTFSKLQGDGAKGCNIDICQNCRVYKRYGNGQPIVIRL